MLHKKLAQRLCTLSCMFFLHSVNSMAQGLPAADTLRLTIVQAEQRFLDSNLQLLAQRYNIRSSQALVEQARKWDNPILSTGQNIYTPAEGYFKHSTVYDNAGNATDQGELSADIEQVIKTAGKRRKQVDIARTNVNIAEWQFNATMRALRLTLLTDLYTIAQLQGNAALYQENMDRLTKLSSAMLVQLNSGNIARKEYLRVQALMVTLQHSMADNAKNLEDAQTELKTIMRIRGNVFIQPMVKDVDGKDIPDLSIVRLIDSAKNHNTEYRSQAYQVQLQQQTIRLQKALAVPDVTVGAVWDQHSTYTANYWGLNVGLPLPLWDRNQGNIKSAKSLLQAEEAIMEELNVKLENDVTGAYKKLLITMQLNSAGNRQFYKDYYEQFRNIADAFNNRRISMLEFLDYYNDYENTREQELQQTLNVQLSKVNLNDIVGKDIVQ